MRKLVFRANTAQNFRVFFFRRQVANPALVFDIQLVVIGVDSLFSEFHSAVQVGYFCNSTCSLTLFGTLINCFLTQVILESSIWRYLRKRKGTCANFFCLREGR